MPRKPAEELGSISLSPGQRARLNATWRTGLMAARAARIIQKIESAPAQQGDNKERRKKRIEIIRMYAGIGCAAMAQSEIAARVGITPQRVQQILASVGLGRSGRVGPVLTPKFLRHFAQRMKANLLAAGYRQCRACLTVLSGGEMSARDRGGWRGLCKPCYADQMYDYRKNRPLRAARHDRGSK
jgi:hypothetical protein